MHVVRNHTRYGGTLILEAQYFECNWTGILVASAHKLIRDGFFALVGGKGQIALLPDLMTARRARQLNSGPALMCVALGRRQL